MKRKHETVTDEQIRTWARSLPQEEVGRLLLRRAMHTDPSVVAEILEADQDRQVSRAIRHECEAADPNPLDKAFADGVVRGVRKARAHK